MVFAQLNKDNLEPCYTPIIQSGGSYNLKPSAFSNEKNLHGGAPRPALPHALSACGHVGAESSPRPPLGLL
jgi:hypothetical protein